MLVTAKLFARLRMATGKDRIEVNIKGNKITDLLEQLAKDYPVKEILYDEKGKVVPLIVVINNLETARITETNTASANGLNKELKKGDVISILEQGCGA
jgi:MoaD family protein